MPATAVTPVPTPSEEPTAMIRLIAALVVLFAVAGPATAAEKPNVLILYTDDMGYGELACYGGKRTPTPHIDALAKDGVRFTDGYVSACVCSPSRVGLMTGRHQCRI